MSPDERSLSPFHQKTIFALKISKHFMKKYFIILLLSLHFSGVSAQVHKKATSVIALFTIDGKSTSTDEFVYLYKKKSQQQEPGLY